MRRSNDAFDQVVVDRGESTSTWIAWGSTREELLLRVTNIFDEHVNDEDEIHIAYNAMQSGWQEQSNPTSPGHGRTDIFFEYSALIVIRHRANRQRQLNDALWALVERLDRN